MRKMDSNRRLNRQRRNSVITSRAALSIVCAALIITASGSGLIMRRAHAEIITDGSVGAAQTLGGPDFDIPQSLGGTQGTNLFHSFQNFNIANTESATFTGANSLQNVISRVTGGQSSSINGVLRSEIGQAAFYFINPAGVVFGADAVVDVPGDFHVSTADEVRFSDGTAFSAVQPNGSALSMAAPAEFGFLGDQSTAIRVEQSRLTFTPDTATSLSGGGLVVDSGILINEGGEIRLTAVGSGDTALPIGPSTIENAMGSLTISSSQIFTGGNGAGRIIINAGDTQISDSSLITSNTGLDPPEPNSGITMAISSLLVDASLVSSGALSSGNSGNIGISATDTVNVINGGNIRTSSAGSGRAGNIDVSATKAVNLLDRGMISSIISAAGDAGNLDVRTGALTIDSQSMALATGVSTNTTLDSTGNAGNINVSATETVSVVNGGVINSSTLGGGNAGNIGVSATETINIDNGGSIRGNTLASGNGGAIAVLAKDISIDGQNSDFSTGVFSEVFLGSLGDAGSVSISVTDSLNIHNGGLISSSTFASGNAGSVTVEAGNFTIDGESSVFATGISTDANSGSFGDAGSVGIFVTDNLNILSGGAISSIIAGSGNAGTVTAQAQNLTIDGQSREFNRTGIFSDSVTEVSGDSGSIDVSVTKTANITNGGQISSDAFGSRDAGKVDVSVTETMNIRNGGSITSVTLASGNAGTVNIEAANLTIDNPSDGLMTGVSSDALPDSSGNAGNVGVSATETITILNGGQISSSTSATGDAGPVNVQAKNLTIDRQDSNSLTGIFSDANQDSFGDAGSIEVSVADLLDIVDGGLISTSTFSQGDAGDISLTAGQVIIDNRNTNFSNGIASTAFPNSSGQAGNINLNVESLSLFNGGLINITSFSDVDFDALASIQPTKIEISATTVTLLDSLISTQSFENVPAGSITVNASKRLFLDPSGIITAANNANGGDISLSGGSAILQNSLVTTSVAGQGDGGDISLDFKNLVLDTGFIQANTAGLGAEGGDIGINVDALTASGNVLSTGGNTPFTFEIGSGNNVIQAAAPDGVSGAIDISSPELNIKGDLAGLTSDLTDADTVVQDPCSVSGSQESALIKGQRGGLPETPQDALGVPLDQNRLNRILSDPRMSDEKSTHRQHGEPAASRLNRSVMELAVMELDCHKP